LGVTRYPGKPGGGKPPGGVPVKRGTPGFPRFRGEKGGGVKGGGLRGKKGKKVKGPGSGSGTPLTV